MITGAISGPQTERQEILRTADELLAQIEFSCVQEGSKRTKGKRRHHGASGLHLPPVTSQEPGPQSVLGRAKDHLTVSCLVRYPLVHPFYIPTTFQAPETRSNRWPPEAPAFATWPHWLPAGAAVSPGAAPVSRYSSTPATSAQRRTRTSAGRS